MSWFKRVVLGHQDVVVRAPVIIQEVQPASPCNPELEEQTKVAQQNYIQGLLALGRRSAELRSTLAQDALNAAFGAKDNA